jgi:hypothetical protein
MLRATLKLHRHLQDVLATLMMYKARQDGDRRNPEDGCRVGVGGRLHWSISARELCVQLAVVLPCKSQLVEQGASRVKKRTGVTSIVLFELQHIAANNEMKHSLAIFLMLICKHPSETVSGSIRTSPDYWAAKLVSHIVFPSSARN